MSSQKHTIKRQYFDVEVFGDESYGAALLNELSDFYKISIAPVLDEVLTRYSNVNEFRVIERIELDLGVLDFHGFNIDSIKIAITKKLTEVLSSALQEDVAKSGRELSLDDQTKPSPTEAHMAYGEKLLAAFLFYLERGILPWSFQLPEGISFIEVVKRDFVSAKFSHGFVQEFILVLNRPYIKFRLIVYMDATVLWALLRAVKPTIYELAQDFYRKLLQEYDIQKGLPLSYFWWDMIFTASTIGSQLGLLKNVQAFYAVLPNSLKSNSTYIEKQKTFLLEIGLSEESYLAAIKSKPENDTVISPVLVAAKTNNKNADRNSINAVTEREDYILATDKSISDSVLSDTEVLADTTYVQLAGMVIVHPFIPRLFEGLGIAKNDHIINQSRAVNLLYFMVTGKHARSEHELALPKILCGISIATPIDIEVEFTLAEQDEVSALLAAVINYWDALKTTSIDGLRGTFLCRNGSLSINDQEDYLLKVEVKAFDILLESLPWSISMIQLPWMNRFLRVEWH